MFYIIIKFIRKGDENRMNVTKNKLKEALDTLGVFPKSSLTKEELLKEFYQFFDERSEQFIAIINPKIYQIMKKLMKADKNGIEVELEAEPEVNFLEEVLLISEPVFTDEKIHIQLREEMKDRVAKLILPKYEKVIKQMQIIVDFIIHLIDAYGIMEDYEVCDRIAHFLGIQISSPILLSLSLYHVDLSYHVTVTDFGDTFYLTNTFINHPEDLIMERESRDLTYKDYTLEELNEDIWDNLQHSKEAQKVIQFLEKKKVEFADEATLSMVLTIMSSPSIEIEDFMKLIPIDFADIHEANEYLQLLMNLHNSIPHYALYGYSPKELVEMQKEQIEHEEKETKKKQRGRNDPCPCGSGKKYKNCCLNKVISVDFRHEASKDCITEEDAKLFFDLKNSLFDYTNKKYHINPDLKDIRDICDAEPEEVIEIRNKIWENSTVIPNYIKENPNGLSPECLSILKEWNKKKINNKFILYKYEEEFAIFMDDNHVYAVKGLKERMKNIIPEAKLPLFVETVLLPFHGQIIYDSYLLQYTLSFGKGMRNMLDKTYQKALKDNSIIYGL